MARKTMAFYPSTPQTEEQGRKLCVEIGPLYVACSLTVEDKPQAFEFFELDNDINDWSDVFFEIKNNSQLLNKYTGTVNIVYNFHEVLMVPMEKLSSAAASDYLTLIYGDSHRHEIKHDKLSDQSGMIAIYRVKNSIIDQAVRHFHLFQAQHLYTPVLKRLFTRADLPTNFLKIQIYPHAFIAVLMVNQQLQMIQTFSYETTEDACYYLLSMLKEHGISAHDTQIEMSGLIEPHGDLHRRLQQLFTNRQFHNLPEELLVPGMLEQYHPHTFTPFFNTVA